MYFYKYLKKLCQLIYGIDCIFIAFGFGRIWMRFNKDYIAACCYGRLSKGWDILTLTCSCRACPAWKLGRMGCIKRDRIAIALHHRNCSHVANQVIVAK